MKMKKGLLALGLGLALAMGVLTVRTVPVQAATVSEKEDNNSRNTANKIKVNTTVTGTLADNSDEDWYVFTLPSDGYFTYDLSSFSSSKSLTLYDSSLNKVSSGYDAYSIHSQRYNYAKGTTFYVRIESGSLGDYEFTINHTPTKSWEIEDNNSRKTAEKLSKKMKGTMISDSDEDWYKYTASESGYVKFKFINEDSVIASDGLIRKGGWNITVYDNNLTELSSWTVSTDATTGIFTVKAKTVLYIKISFSRDVQDCVYSIAPVFKATQYVEKENNNSFKKATTIKSGKKYVGVLNYSTDEDYYKFVAPSSGKFKISFEFSDDVEVEHGYDVTIYGSSKKEMKTISDITDEGSAKVKMKKGKTYYIHVADGSSSGTNWVAKYKIKVSKVK